MKFLQLTIMMPLVKYKIDTLHLFEIKRVWVTGERDSRLMIQLSMKNEEFQSFLEGVEFNYEEIDKSDEYDKVYLSVHFDENWGGAAIYVKNINDGR